MLDNLKLLLGIEDDSLDDRLTLIINNTTARLKALLGGIDPPDSLSYIIEEVSVIRFNRIGSEGVSSHSVEGESMTFNDDDFAGYKDDIQAYLDTIDTTSTGRIRFL